MAATPGADIPVERPSGSFVSVTHDGFEVSSNTGSEEDIRTELGIGATPDTAEHRDGAEPLAELPSKARPARQDPRSRKQSIKAEIDAEVARRETAKQEADAEETRLTKLREEAKTYSQPRQVPQPIAQPQPQQFEAPKPKDYDGSDASDPEPKQADFAADPSGDPYTAWLMAKTAHTARSEWRKQQFAQQQTQRQQSSETRYHARVSALQEKLKAHETKDPEFKTKIDPEVASALTWSTPNTVGTPLGDLVMDAPNTTELLLHFSANKPEMQRIMNLHPLLQAMELGEIKGRLSAQAAHAEAQPPRPRPVSQAKPPIRIPAGSPAKGEDNRPDEELSDEEHDARYASIRRQYR